MRILDEKDNELAEDQVDLSVGYLTYDQILKEHHDAVVGVQEKGHYYPQTFYFTDGTKYVVNVDGENDPCVKRNEDGMSFSYVAPEGEEPREYKGCDLKYFIDVERQDGKPAYDEMEDIQRYKLYTEEELKAKREAEEKKRSEAEFLSSGPSRLSTVETDVNDMTLTIADLIGA